MQFSRGRMAKLAGLLTEGVKEESDRVEETETEESDKVDEYGHSETVYEIEEKTMEESYDLRKIIRDEIKRSLDSRDEATLRYTSGQRPSERTKSYGTVTMGFPGIGFKR